MGTARGRRDRARTYNRQICLHHWIPIPWWHYGCSSSLTESSLTRFFPGSIISRMIDNSHLWCTWILCMFSHLHWAGHALNPTSKSVYVYKIDAEMDLLQSASARRHLASTHRNSFVEERYLSVILWGISTWISHTVIIINTWAEHQKAHQPAICTNVCSHLHSLFSVPYFNLDSYILRLWSNKLTAIRTKKFIGLNYMKPSCNVLVWGE